MTAHSFFIDSDGNVIGERDAGVGDSITFTGSIDRYPVVFIYLGSLSKEPFGSTAIGSSMRHEINDGRGRTFYLATSGNEQTRTNGKLTVKP